MKFPPVSEPVLQESRTLQEQITAPPTRIVVPFEVVGVTTTAADVFTVPDQQIYQIDKLFIHNPNMLSRDIDIWVVPDGGTAGATNLAYHAAIATNGTTEATPLEGFLIGQGGALRAESSADTLNLFITCTQIVSGQ